jgi:hypothetical protein
MTSRLGAVLAVLAWAALLAACGTSKADAPTPSPTVAGASQAPSGASPAEALRPGQAEVLALDALSLAAATLARGMKDRIGVAVYVPSQQRMYQYNAEPEFPIASVIKLPVMLAVMDRAVQKGEAISQLESDLISAMITQSDNDATTELWNMIGGAPAVEGFLERTGITGATIDRTDWGESAMSAQAAARLMGKLIQGEILDGPHRDYALELLTHVDPTQDWGAVVVGQEHGRAGVKNGWYPEYEGWVLASVGYVLPEDDSPAFAIAVFTNGWDSFTNGVRQLESISGLINNTLLAE